VGQNPYLCESGQCNKKRKEKKNIVIPLLSTVCGVLILLMTVAAVLWTLERRKPRGETTIITLKFLIEKLPKIFNLDLLKFSKTVEQLRP